MKLYVLGASGGVGQRVVRFALARGHEVTAHIRATSSWAAPGRAAVVREEILEGGPLQALPGHDAVLCCIGQRHIRVDNPLSPMAPPHDLCERVARILVDAMPQAGVRRVLAISAGGVGDSRKALHPALRLALPRSPLAVAYRDLAAMEAVFRASDLDWMCIRPTLLTELRATGKARVTRRFGLTSTIPRGDVAAWMLDRVADPAPLDQTGDRTPLLTVSGPR